MIIEDKAYSKFDVNDEVILELMSSSPMRRITHISQQGIPHEFSTSHIEYSRYEHCVGVMLLLRKLGAGIEEQVSGLLHDVSHTAFSHTTDMIFGDYSKQNMQDDRHEEFFDRGEIAAILKKHNMDPDRVANEKLFGFLERNAPDLCADRLDYSLRDLYYYGNPEYKNMLQHLIPVNGEIMFDSGDVAVEYGKQYSWLQSNHYAELKDMAAKYVFSAMIRAAIDSGKLAKSEIMDGTDESVMQIVRKIEDEKVKKLLDALDKGNYEVVQGGNIELKGKSRYVDPKFIENNTIKRASEISDDYKAMIDELKKHSADGFKVRITVNGEDLE